MNDQEARALKAGDRVIIGDLPATVTHVMAYSGLLGRQGPYAIDFEFDTGGAGRVSGAFLADIELLPGSAPEWWNEVMTS